uniref:Uncharacterized protein n=1 Tax=Parascaris equorum TaxID=6256 RepID=A0A914RA91_PAREQ
MATRSRRSGAGSETLNPAMIHLLDTGTTNISEDEACIGAHYLCYPTFSDRDVVPSQKIYIIFDARVQKNEAVDLERMGHHSYSPPPFSEKSPRKASLKRTAKVKEEVEGDQNQQPDEPLEPPSKKAKNIGDASQVDEVEIVEESFSIEFSNDVSSDLAAITGVAQPRVYETLPEIENKPNLAKAKRTSGCSATAMKLPCHTTSSESNHTTVTRIPRRKRKGSEQQTTEDVKELAQPAYVSTYEKETDVELRVKMDLKAKKPEKAT